MKPCPKCGWQINGLDECIDCGWAEFSWGSLIESANKLIGLKTGDKNEQRLFDNCRHNNCNTKRI